jgi:hypothetical protein
MGGEQGLSAGRGWLVVGQMGGDGVLCVTSVVYWVEGCGIWCCLGFALRSGHADYTTWVNWGLIVCSEGFLFSRLCAFGVREARCVEYSVLSKILQLKGGDVANRLR